MISVVILEDDPIFRDMLLDMLPKATIKTNLLATCSTIRQAKEAIEQFSPQLVLLDVELPDGKGMELLTHYDEFGSFETIFITSYDKYAIDAIKKNAADYIVKPVKQTELNEALAKVQKRLDIYSKLLKVEELTAYVDKLKQQNLQENKIMINTNEGAIFIKIVASKTLSVFEEMLEALNFMRIHRSFIINLTKIKNIESDNGNYSAKMIDNSKVEISRRKKKEFFEAIAYNG